MTSNKTVVISYNTGAHGITVTMVSTAVNIINNIKWLYFSKIFVDIKIIPYLCHESKYW